MSTEPDGPPSLADAGWLVERLIPWYREHARDLPWRREPTPYRVLLSEVMLQQTRVETVLPYFERFLARWPTLDDLAAAPDDEVLAAWAGLGYYSRARRLLATARAASALGGLPETVDELLGLPGIGPYTAGAVASIAFGVAAPLVDGNVERVI
ncbi:MAG: A/G-specific adenine glycosylase, partial [Myxococcales bacterium]|nr:A/G-specific adenine glycosylase [Myxococcales bacterium]